MHVDIAVVGGGINGLAVARELASRCGAMVAVFDEHKPGGASCAAAGLLGAQVEAASLPEGLRHALFPILREGRTLHEFLDLYTRGAAGLGTGYRCAGALHVARNEVELDAIESRYGWQREYGAAVVRLSATQARQLEPSLSPSIAGAIYLPDEAVVEPASLLRALRATCGSLGVIAVEGRVRRIEIKGGRARGVRTDDGVWGADVVVLAAGGGIVGLEGVPRQLASIRAAPARTVLFRGGRPLERIVLSERGYLVPWGNGNLALSSRGGDDGDPLAALYSSIALMPSLTSRCVWHTRVGYRPVAPGALPWAGRTDLPGLFAMTGNVRNGLLLAPSTAAHIVDLIEGREQSAGPLALPARRGVSSAAPAA